MRNRGGCAPPATPHLGGRAERLNPTHHARHFTRTRRGHQFWSLQVPPNSPPPKKADSLCSLLDLVDPAPSAAFIFVHKLSRQIIRKGSYLERGSTAARINGVQLDPIELIIGKDRNDFAGLELGPAHPSRGDGYSKPRFGAGNDAVGRGNRYRPLHGYGFCFPRSCETPAAPAGKTRAEDAVVPGEICERSW